MADRMFVVIEWNQASHQPRVACEDLHDTHEEAIDCMERLADQIQGGRREWFSVHEVEYHSVAEVTPGGTYRG